MRVFLFSMIALSVYFPVRVLLFGDRPVFGDSTHWFFSDVACLMLIGAIVIGIQAFRFPLRTFSSVFQFWVIESAEEDSQQVHAYLASSVKTTAIVSVVLAGVVAILDRQALLAWTHVEHPALFALTCGLLAALLQFMIPLHELRRQMHQASQDGAESRRGTSSDS